MRRDLPELSKLLGERRLLDEIARADVAGILAKHARAASFADAA